MLIPTLVLKQLYTFGSLKNTEEGVQFSLKNRLSDAKISGVVSLSLGGTEVATSDILLDLGGGNRFTPEEINSGDALDFPLRKTLNIIAKTDHLDVGKHEIRLTFKAKPFGELKLKVEGSIVKEEKKIVRIPRNERDDYSDEAIEERHQFVEDYTGVKIQHVGKHSFDPHVTNGNCEHFIGVAQIPMGIAGPIKINGEHAQGEFLVPMATSEGTLVASYNRGIKVLNLSGGATCTIVDDAMQRAPVFVFDTARGSKKFMEWVNAHIDEIREQAEGTTSVGKLTYLDPYYTNHFLYIRFNYTTGDAAGQNMVGRATFAACSWILDHYPKDDPEMPPIKHFFLESNFATDKKASQVNIMRTRGKRVIAEAVIKKDVLIQHMRVTPETLHYEGTVATVGAFFSGANNNGAHSPNAITAIFIATGQDVANVAESSAAIVYSEMTEEGDLYMSITIPSLIVATFGGGTGLPTQQECLRMLGCTGRNTVHKFAEIIAGVVLAGEISLGSAIASSDWVSSHEKYGRNR